MIKNKNKNKILIFITIIITIILSIAIVNAAGMPSLNKKDFNSVNNYSEIEAKKYTNVVQLLPEKNYGIQWLNSCETEVLSSDSKTKWNTLDNILCDEIKNKDHNGYAKPTENELKRKAIVLSESSKSTSSKVTGVLYKKALKYQGKDVDMVMSFDDWSYATTNNSKYVPAFIAVSEKAKPGTIYWSNSMENVKSTFTFYQSGTYNKDTNTGVKIDVKGFLSVYDIDGYESSGFHTNNIEKFYVNPTTNLNVKKVDSYILFTGKDSSTVESGDKTKAQIAATNKNKYSIRFSGNNIKFWFSRLNNAAQSAADAGYQYRTGYQAFDYAQYEQSKLNEDPGEPEVVNGVNKITQKTQIEFNQSSSYSITLPKTVILNGETGSADYLIEIGGNLSAANHVEVKPNSSILSQKNKENISAIVTQNQEYASRNMHVRPKYTKWNTADGSFCTRRSTDDGMFGMTVYVDEYDYSYADTVQKNISESIPGAKLKFLEQKHNKTGAPYIDIDTSDEEIDINTAVSKTSKQGKTDYSYAIAAYKSGYKIFDYDEDGNAIKKTINSQNFTKAVSYPYGQYCVNFYRFLGSHDASGYNMMGYYAMSITDSFQLVYDSWSNNINDTFPNLELDMYHYKATSIPIIKNSSKEMAFSSFAGYSGATSSNKKMDFLLGDTYYKSKIIDGQLYVISENKNCPVYFKGDNIAKTINNYNNAWYNMLVAATDVYIDFGDYYLHINLEDGYQNVCLKGNIKSPITAGSWNGSMNFNINLENEQISSDEKTSYEMEQQTVDESTYNEDILASTYTVKIPKYISVWDTNSIDYQIGIKNKLVSDSYSILITPQDDINNIAGDNFYLTQGDSKIAATIKQDKYYLTNADGLNDNNYTYVKGTVTASPIYAGRWKGYATFNVQQSDYINYMTKDMFTWNGSTVTGLTDKGKTYLEGNGGKLYIPAYTTAIENDAFSSSKIGNATLLTEVYIAKRGLTSIGNNAFKGNTELTTINLPKIDLITIGNSAFNGCSKLNNIIIPDSVTTLGTYVFANNTLLTNVTLSKSLETINSYDFQNCKNLINVDLPESIKTIKNNAFQNCSALTDITMPDSVTDIGTYAFADNKLLKNVKLSNSISIINNGTFRNCSALTDITIPDSVTNIGEYAFDNCDSLTEVVIPDSVTTIGRNAYSNNALLETVKLPSNITSIGYQAFAYNPKLRIISYKDETENVCRIPDTVTAMGDDTVRGTIIEKAYLPKNETLTKIPGWMFKGCNNLTYVHIPNTFNNFNNSETFRDCGKLETIEFEEGTQIAIGNSSFYNCPLLKNFDFSIVTSIGTSSFYNCDALTNINLTEGCKTIGNNTFQNCDNLIQIKLPDSLINVGTTIFNGCKNMPIVTLNRYAAVSGGMNENYSYTFATGYSAITNIICQDTSDINGITYAYNRIDKDGWIADCKQKEMYYYIPTSADIGIYGEITITNIKESVFTNSYGVIPLSLKTSYDIGDNNNILYYEEKDGNKYCYDNDGNVIAVLFDSSIIDDTNNYTSIVENNPNIKLIFIDGEIIYKDGKYSEINTKLKVSECSEYFADILTKNDIDTVTTCDGTIYRDTDGCIYSSVRQTRYISVYMNGSNKNSSNHIYEIQAIDTEGNNIALNKQAIVNGSNVSRITDGSLSAYADIGTNKTIDIDLGDPYSINTIKMWRYYSDSRYYKDTVIKVSADKQNWTTVWDAAVDGNYTETSEGKEFYVGGKEFISYGRSAITINDSIINETRTISEILTTGYPERNRITYNDAQILLDKNDKVTKVTINGNFKDYENKIDIITNLVGDQTLIFNDIDVTIKNNNIIEIEYKKESITNEDANALFDKYTSLNKIAYNYNYNNIIDAKKTNIVSGTIVNDGVDYAYDLNFDVDIPYTADYKFTHVSNRFPTRSYKIYVDNTLIGSKNTTDMGTYNLTTGTHNIRITEDSGYTPIFTNFIVSANYTAYYIRNDYGHIVETNNLNNIPDGHTFGSYVYNNDATITEDGTITGTCSCGETNLYILPNSHLFACYNVNSEGIVTSISDDYKTEEITFEKYYPTIDFDNIEVKGFANGLFNNYNSLTKIIIKNNVFAGFDYTKVFEECSSLESIEFKDITITRDNYQETSITVFDKFEDIKNSDIRNLFNLNDNLTSIIFTDQAIEKDSSIISAPAGIEYIESTGTQYIDTGICAQSGLNITVDSEFTSSNNHMSVFGGQNSSSSNRYHLYYHENASMYYYYASSGYPYYKSADYKDRHIYKINDNILSVDGVTKITNTASLFTSTYNMFIFANNNAGKVASNACMRLYSFSILKDGNVLRYLIPALDCSNTPCLYDKVTDKYYYNQGTGQFTYPNS